jgi:hypothetical protein
MFRISENLSDVRPRATPGRVKVATFTATKADDSGQGSLRQAILAANATAGADTIVFDSAAFANRWK